MILKSHIFFFGILFVVSVALFVPQTTFAETVNQCKVETPQFLPAGYWGQNPPLLPCGVTDPDTGEKVDCLQCGLCGLLMLGQRIIYLMLSLLFFVVAPIRFIWGGFLILVSRGSSETVNQGRKMIYHTVIGLMIGLGAFLIVQTFLWLLGSLGGDQIGWPDIKCQRNIRPLS